MGKVPDKDQIVCNKFTKKFITTLKLSIHKFLSKELSLSELREMNPLYSFKDGFYKDRPRTDLYGDAVIYFIRYCDICEPGRSTYTDRLFWFLRPECNSTEKEIRKLADLALKELSFASKSYCKSNTSR